MHLLKKNCMQQYVIEHFIEDIQNINIIRTIKNSMCHEKNIYEPYKDAFSMCSKTKQCPLIFDELLIDWLIALKWTFKAQ